MNTPQTGPERFHTRLRTRLRQDPRIARVLRGGASSLLARLVALLVSVLTLPLTLHYLGKLEYGIWVTVSTSVLLLSVLDLGIGNTLTNLIAEAFAKDDRDGARRVFASAFWATTAIATFLTPVSFVLWRLVDWASLFHLSDPVVIAHTAQCSGIAILFFLLSLPLTLAARVLGGYQQVHIANYFIMGGSLLSLLALVLAMLLHGTLVALMVAYCLGTLLAALALNLWLMLHRWPWLRPSPRHVGKQALRQLFDQGSLFFILQLTVVVVFNSDNLVITHFLGADAVTAYSTAWRLAQYSSALQSFLTPALWPAFAEAYHKRQMDWVVSTYHSIQRNTLLAVGAAALVLGAAGRPIIRLWAGAAAVPGQRLLWLMAAFAFVMAVTSTQALLLTATGRLRPLTAAAVLAAVANLALSIVLVQRIGTEGVILSTLLSFLVFMVGPQQLEVHRVLKGHYLKGDRSALEAKSAIRSHQNPLVQRGTGPEMNRIVRDEAAEQRSVDDKFRSITIPRG